jgi:hypothetical protein
MFYQCNRPCGLKEHKDNAFKGWKRLQQQILNTATGSLEVNKRIQVMRTKQHL